VYFNVNFNLFFKINKSAFVGERTVHISISDFLYTKFIFIIKYCLLSQPLFQDVSSRFAPEK